MLNSDFAGGVQEFSIAATSTVVWLQGKLQVYIKAVVPMHHRFYRDLHGGHAAKAG